jgi:large subunit ribosomal protein L3
VPGQFVDVTGHLDRQGLCRRHEALELRRSRATHGVSVSHRSHGSTGNRQDPGKVFKNKKMAGHMGAERVTTQNLEGGRTDVERGLIWSKGAVPGSKGGWIRSRRGEARFPKAAPLPGCIQAAGRRSGPAAAE